MLLSLSWLHFLISIKIIKYICKRECECLCRRKIRLAGPFFCAFSYYFISFFRRSILLESSLPGTAGILAQTKVTDLDGLGDPSHL